MKILEFPSVKLYEMFYEGLMTANTKGAETRTLAKILAKVEDQGTPKLLPNDEAGMLYTAAQAVIIELEDAEYTLAKRLLDDVVWNGNGTKDAAKLLEFVETAPTKKIEKTLKLESKRAGELEKSE